MEISPAPLPRANGLRLPQQVQDAGRSLGRFNPAWMPSASARNRGNRKSVVRRLPLSLRLSRRRSDTAIARRGPGL